MDILKTIYLNEFGKKLVLFCLAVIFFGCSVNDDQQSILECDLSDEAHILGEWNDPKFLPSSNSCYLDQCLAISFELNSDSSYHLWYSVSDFMTNSILREINDQGKFEFDCTEAGNLSGKFSSLRYLKGQLILNSNSISQMEWTLAWNGVEGLILPPEFLGFTHDGYIKLN